MKLTIEDLMPRVRRGADWLDQQKPGAVSALDIDTLQMGSCTRCAIGQTFGRFFGTLDRFMLTFDWAVDGGFAIANADYGEQPAAYDLLRKCWVTVILERRFKEQSSLPTPAQESDAVDVLVSRTPDVHARV